MNQIRVQADSSNITRLLQQAVDAETTSRNLYWARAVFWRGRGFKRLADYYQKQSEELHAQASADRMVFLGATPNMEPQPLTGVIGTLREQFEQDVAVEGNLAEMYVRAISLAGEDFVTEDIWRAVLRETEEHVQFLQGELTKMELIGEDSYLLTWLD